MNPLIEDNVNPIVFIKLVLIGFPNGFNTKFIYCLFVLSFARATIKKMLVTRFEADLPIEERQKLSLLH